MKITGKNACLRNILREKIRTKKKSKQLVDDLMTQDSEDKVVKYGQHVADAFWESDYFVDNTPNEEDSDQFTINDDLGRLIDTITHSKIVRPTIAETGMHVAVSAQITFSIFVFVRVSIFQAIHEKGHFWILRNGGRNIFVFRLKKPHEKSLIARTC